MYFCPNYLQPVEGLFSSYVFSFQPPTSTEPNGRNRRYDQVLAINGHGISSMDDLPEARLYPPPTYPPHQHRNKGLTN